jgi:hypothetical protein
MNASRGVKVNLHVFLDLLTNERYTFPKNKYLSCAFSLAEDSYFVTAGQI